MARLPMEPTVVRGIPAGQARALPPLAATSKGGRLAGLDAVRFLAAVGVVGIHANTAYISALDGQGRFAVPFFTIAAIFLLARSLDRSPDGGSDGDGVREWWAYGVARARRLYVPFLAWSVIYQLGRWTKRLTVSDEPLAEWDWKFLATGTAVHLWFLPYLLVVGLAVFPIIRWGRRSPQRRVSLGLACAVLGVAAAGLPADPTNPWTWGLPAVLWGISLWGLFGFLGGAGVESRRGLSLSWPWAWAALAGAVLCIGLTMVLGRNRWLETLAGLGLMIAALGPWEGPAIRALAILGRFSLGIYLSHLLFVDALRTLGQRWLQPDWHLIVTIWSASLAASLALAWLLDRSRFTRWLVAV